MGTMKVRWTEESLRLRLTPSELAQLEAHLPIDAALSLGAGGGWRVELMVAEAATTLTQLGATLRISLAPVDLLQLLGPDVEGVYFESDGVRYYVEKDFPCAHPRAIEALEPKTETFPAPDDFEERKVG
jgi:hypothetical protein